MINFSLLLSAVGFRIRLDCARLLVARRWFFSQHTIERWAGAIWPETRGVLALSQPWRNSIKP
ncbi:hypothetical protein COCVIDRAFT_93391 [Bipolaris victoriae FI3]|uniref:Uncharacterized protein n=2 Tax=Bipolaris TaxID=33194 RepID=W6YHS9_COCC2|nr:uncharacterized protein COCCADRAFT_102753 [Bipolaris zeicola 26-R-13]XP_014558821.1 hypothetical protein COCVIDRAFT_93391 [Bipolaris victoriae FI3]EUC30871.1 hypothetical protein COCCADRAFT_102753 [Bipolaris zeicola 26-R-13]